MKYEQTVSNMDSQTVLQERESLINRIDEINEQIAQTNEGHGRTKLYKEQKEIAERFYIIMTYGNGK